MSQEFAVQNIPHENTPEILKSVRTAIETVSPYSDAFGPDIVLATMGDMEASLEADYKRIADVEDLLFAEEMAGYGERCTSVFSRWDEDSGQSPSMLAFIIYAWDKFGLGDDEALAKAGVIAGVMAEIGNDLQYHGNEHYRKVMFHLIRLIAANNWIHAEGEHVFTSEDVALLLIAGAVHDLGHEGGDNTRDGIYTPGYMEQRSFDIAKPYFEALGITLDQIKSLETLIFCTDITIYAGDNSPCVRMRRIFDYYFVDQSDSAVLNYMMGKLRLFDDNPHFALMAMILHEADIGTSAGLSYEQSIKETIDIIEEMGMRTAGPKILLTFLKEQLGGDMKTDAGKVIFSSAMDAIMDQALGEMIRGRKTFYED